jgi:hypothetical protein
MQKVFPCIVPSQLPSRLAEFEELRFGSFDCHLSHKHIYMQTQVVPFKLKV